MPGGGGAGDLFSAALDERLARQAPLAARMRPRTLADMVGQQHLLAPGRPLRALIDTDRLSSVILWGPPGTGKTTLARLIAGATSKEFIPLSAVTAGVKDVREAADAGRRRLAEQGRGTILFLDFTSRPIGVRLVRSGSRLALWDTPPGRRCTPHWWREHRDVDAGGRPSGAARESSRRAALLRGARHGHGFCPRPS